MVRYIEENDNENYLTIQETLPSAYLTLIVNGHISHSFPVRGEVQLGRDKSNAVVAADQKVSRHHALLTPVGNTYIINDQGSANGTYVNGVMISQPTRLKDNDRINFGDTTFLFTTSQPDPKLVDRPLSWSALPIHDLAPKLTQDNRPVWAVVGCMALLIVALLLLVVLLVGIFVGRSQVVGLELGWLVSLV